MSDLHKTHLYIKVKVHPVVRTVETGTDLWFQRYTDDVSDKFSSNAAIISARPADKFPASERHCPWLVPIYTVW